MTQPTQKPTPTKTIRFHGPMLFFTCRGYGDLDHTQDNRTNLLRQGYTIAAGVKDGVARYFFFDESCPKCRQMTFSIRETLRTKEGSA